MSEKHRTADLEGALLDAAIEKALLPPSATSVRRPVPRPFSTDWAQGGPIIERERIHLAPYAASQGGWCAYAQSNVGQGCLVWDGPTALIAAMRAFVASKLGEEVELP